MTDGYTVAHLLPRDTPRQRVAESVVDVTPEPSERDEHVDAFGNRVTQFGVHHPHDELVVEAVEHRRRRRSDADRRRRVVERRGRSRRSACGATMRSRSARSGRGRASSIVDRVGAELAAIAYGSFTPGRAIVEAAHDLCHRIFDEFTYDSTATDVSSPLADVLASRRGVCQDFAHLAAGVPALDRARRTVRERLHRDRRRRRAVTALVGADASHAWCSIWTPSAGWIDFDPTNDHFPTRRHVTVAWGRDYADVTPVRGVVIGPSRAQTLDVAVDVACSR